MYNCRFAVFFPYVFFIVVLDFIIRKFTADILLHAPARYIDLVKSRFSTNFFIKLLITIGFYLIDIEFQCKNITYLWLLIRWIKYCKREKTITSVSRNTYLIFNILRLYILHFIRIWVKWFLKKITIIFSISDV